MKIKSIIKIALVPIWLLILLFSIQYIFGLISEPSDVSVILGILLLGIFIFVSILIFKKIYCTHE